ncbi:hypothetical protein LTR37_005381 [Vermiconidia calcicola]|uniref:Uncharacterized protein n=1 Tax=Vermiconidia calcicola TaxID=1690605 RepID=A0ACC3NJF4_9PEZI|nr:hypothetical protein LTR37_005381 [Vermiconidia calcicola]
MVEHLMAAVLLCDYQLRMSNYGEAFMLSAITARMAQALQINLEHSTDVLCQGPASGPSASTKESRRRLMWCCYCTDSLVGSGVDQLTLIKESDIKIQLPCNERIFLLQSACITELLEQNKFLKFLDQESLPAYPLENIGMRAYHIRYIAIRRKVLKYIKHLDTAKLPWLLDSEFAQLGAESRAWYASLPDSLQFTPAAIYIRKETQQIGALVSLHYVYHQTMCDIYRIGAPALYKLRSAFSFPVEQTAFLTTLQSELFFHARSLASVTAEGYTLTLAKALRHGPNALADTRAPTIVYDCCRVMLFYLTQILDPSAEQSKALMSETIPLVQSNIKALKAMQSMYPVAELLSNAAEKMLEKVGGGAGSIIPDEPYPNNDPDGAEQSAPGTPVQSAPDYVMNPLSIYRMARKKIPEKHAPEKQPVISSPAGASTGWSTLQRRSALQQASCDNSIIDPTNNTAPNPAQTVNSHGVATQNQAAFDDLLSLFASDPSGWTWQPSDTAIGSHSESNGLPPWEPTYVDQQLDAWIGDTQQYGF